MIIKIYNSIYKKPMALLLVISFLFMSFNMNGKGEVTLNAGTNIILESISLIQSDLISVGQTIDFRVKYDVKVDEQIVIRSGSIAKGQVMRSQKAKGVGKAGFLEIQIRTVTAVDGQEVFLTGGNVYQDGEDKQTLALVLGLVLCIFLLLIKGTNAQVPPGYQVTSYVATTMTIIV